MTGKFTTLKSAHTNKFSTRRPEHPSRINEILQHDVMCDTNVFRTQENKTVNTVIRRF